MQKNILSLAFWVLFLGGLFGVVSGVILFFNGSSPVEYGVMGIGGGAFLVWSAIAAFVQSKL